MPHFPVIWNLRIQELRCYIFQGMCAFKPTFSRKIVPENSIFSKHSRAQSALSQAICAGSLCLQELQILHFPGNLRARRTHPLHFRQSQCFPAPPSPILSPISSHFSVDFGSHWATELSKAMLVLNKDKSVLSNC